MGKGVLLFAFLEIRWKPFPENQGSTFAFLENQGKRLPRKSTAAQDIFNANAIAIAKCFACSYNLT
nr:MAG TPA: hypothetical protein [Caudoviricetes sp.]